MEDFNAIAKGFDTDRRQARAKIIAAAIRDALPESVRTGIEFGCGTGLIGLQLRDRFDALLLTDLYDGMIAELEKKLSALNDPHLSARCCDLVDDPPADLRADCIFSSMVLHHVQDVDKALISMRGLLNEGGRLIIIDLCPDDGSFHLEYPDFNGHDGFDPIALCERAAHAGFRDAKIEIIFSDTKVIRGEEKTYSLFLLSAIAS